ncbi:hypothetical protein D3C86_1702510 [compost metagenome]
MPGQGVDRRLAGGVGEVAHVAGQGLARRDVDDRSRSPLQHGGNGVFAEQHRAAGVDRLDLVPEFDRHVRDVEVPRGKARRPRVIVKNIDAAEGLHAGFDHRPDVVLARKVAGLAGDVVAMPFQPLGHRFKFGRPEIGQQNPRPLLGQGQGRL